MADATAEAMVLQHIVAEPRLGVDHCSLVVKDLQKAKEFYTKVLAPLKYSLFMDQPCIVGFVVGSSPDFWLSAKKPGDPEGALTHVAFSATSRAMVDAFYEAAIAAGAKCNGKPGLRTEYHPDYYAAFVYDLDGYNMEAVCHLPADKQVA